jgi:hypothetical protein
VVEDRREEPGAANGGLFATNTLYEDSNEAGRVASMNMKFSRDDSALVRYARIVVVSDTKRVADPSFLGRAFRDPATNR